MTYDSTVTLGDFLKSINTSLITDEAVSYVCMKRMIDYDLPCADISERDRDLAEGTMYYWLSNLPVGGSTEKVSDGGWSHSEGGWTVSKTNIDAWLKKYRDLFAKWDEKPMGSTIRIINF